MSDTPPPPDWLPYALDRLEDAGLMEARSCLEALFAELPEMETRLKLQLELPYIERVTRESPLVRLIAAARDESPGDTLIRLAPPSRSWRLETQNENWNPANATPLADILAMQERLRYSYDDMYRQNPPPPEPEPEPVRPLVRRGLADYLRARIDAGIDPPATNGRRPR